MRPPTELERVCGQSQVEMIVYTRNICSYQIKRQQTAVSCSWFLQLTERRV